MKSYKRVPSALSALLVFGAFALGVSGCGAPDASDKRMLEQSDILQAPAPPNRQICGDGVNIRDSSLAVTGTANRGEKITLMPERIAGSGPLAGNVFARVYVHKEPAGYGYVGQQFVCALDAVTPPTGERTIDVNYTTNRLKYFVGGKLVREWNVGTMRQAVIDAGDYKVGTFTLWAKQVCPPWTKPGSATTIAGCVAANPLGTRGLWFSTYLYGLHGTTEAWKIADGTSADQRRVSSGCIRNTNANIEWLYDQVKIGDKVTLHW